MLTHFKSAYQYSVTNCNNLFHSCRDSNPQPCPKAMLGFDGKTDQKDLFLQLLARSFSLRECRRKLTARCLPMKLLKIIMMRKKKKKKRPNERSNTEQRTVRKIYRNKLRVAANVNFVKGLFTLRFGLLYVILYAKRNFRMEFDQCETGRTWVLGMD